MKTAKNILRVLTVVFSAGALLIFFMGFARFITADGSGTASGAVLAFGSDIKIAGESINLAKSSKILFTMLLTAFGTLFAGLSFKFKFPRFASVVCNLAAAIYMLVYRVKGAYSFVDTRPVEGLTGLELTPFVWVLVALLFLAAFCGAAFTLVADYVECKGKLTIPKRLARMFREYKSEIKKIVWPGPRSVVKNTVAVLIMCLVLGAFIWLLDFGLGRLIGLILS